EELLQVVGVHADPVVGDRPAIHAEFLHGLPFEAEVDPRGLCFDRVFQELASPLIGPAGLEHSIDEVRGAGDADAHWRPPLLGGLGTVWTAAASVDMALRASWPWAPLAPSYVREI